MMNQEQENFVNAVLARVNNHTTTQAELFQAIAYIDAEMKEDKPALYAAMMETRKLGF